VSLLDRFRQDPKELVGSEARTPLGWTRTLGRIAIGVLTLGLVANAPMIPAVAGLLGVSGAALIKLLRKTTTEFDLASINILPKAERFLALSDRLDKTRLWIRSATFGAILSIVPIVFWNTAEAYLGSFGWMAALPWGLAAMFTAIPVILFLWEALGLAREGQLLRQELEDEASPDSLGPAFSM